MVIQRNPDIAFDVNGAFSKSKPCGAACADLQDMSMCSQPAGFCWKHGKNCKVPVSDDLHMMVGGFSCKSNSPQKPGQDQ